MTPWYLIAVAVLGAGCEQLKSPERIHKLEGRVDELSAAVTALKGGSGAATPDGHGAGSGAGSTEAHAAAGSDATHGAGSGEAPAAAEPHAAAADESHAGGAPPAPPDHGSQAGSADGEPEAKHDDPALDELKQVVAKSTGKHDDAKPHWSYDSATGPRTWGKLDPAWRVCAEGKAQSPIDIEPRAGSASPIAIHYKPTAATVVDNGHTLQVNLEAGNSIEIDDRAYDLLQFHFHMPSEHTIAGERYPLEVHLVHKDATGKLVVIGVLYDAGGDARPLRAVWPPWPRKVGVETKLSRPFDPNALLPETRTVFRYPGSLTTPPCSEGVLWNVMRRTMSDGAQHLELFADHYRRTARPVQPLNGRKVE